MHTTCTCRSSIGCPFMLHPCLHTLALSVTMSTSQYFYFCFSPSDKPKSDSRDKKKRSRSRSHSRSRSRSGYEHQCIFLYTAYTSVLFCVCVCVCVFCAAPETGAVVAGEVEAVPETVADDRTHDLHAEGQLMLTTPFELYTIQQCNMRCCFFSLFPFLSFPC